MNCSIKTRSILALLLIAAANYFPALSHAEGSPLNREALEVRVRQLDFQDASVQSEQVDVVFQLASLYEAEGNIPRAIELYEKGLKIDSWRWEHQLALAKLLFRSGTSSGGAERARRVFRYAEDSSLVGAAENLLAEKGFPIEQPKTAQDPSSKKAAILLIPIGEVDRRLLDEVLAGVQTKTGIAYRVAEQNHDPGQLDVKGKQVELDELASFLEESLPTDRMAQALAKQRMTLKDLRTVEGMKKFLSEITGPESQAAISALEKNLEEAGKDRGRFDAYRLRREIEKSYPMGKNPGIRGYLGVIGRSITGEDKKGAIRATFAPGQGYGVMTYWVFLGSVQGEKPNRVRLKSRFMKEILYNSFEMLGLAGCSDPVCVIAPSDHTPDIDEKNEDLCSDCRTRLANYLEKIQPGVYPPHRVVKEANELVNEGRYGEATKAFEQARQLDPENVEVGLLQARLYDDAHQLEEARTLYLELMKKNPDRADVVAAFLWFCAGHPWWPVDEDEGLAIREGLAAGEKALTRWGTDPVFLETYGWLAYKGEKLELAEQLIRKSLDYQITARRFYTLSVVCSQLKKRGEALKAFKQAEEASVDPKEDRDFRQMAETMLQGMQ